ncbi:glycerate 2-kinase [Halomicrobium zhouii]|uniref:Glycerate 2-kinase n=1 Tax=Halomicrobium zhouii TaxID=767519 RepID=A0A1I6LGP9_9EURY|nr:DUF4147 domain-containing protein [Halomicrobium zhouii]SFS02592.1 glycerate 2-kinase [Halomicrobium zhouii]
MIEERSSLARTPAHDLALECVEAGIEAATPERVLRDHVSLDGDVLRVADGEYDLTRFDDVVVLGGGKAGTGVAAALEAVLGDRLSGGVVVTDELPAGATDTDARTGGVDVVVGDHPVPSERGLEGARQVLDAAAAADEGTLVLAVITGGASALLPAPVSGVGLSSLRTVTELLLECGATIDEINAVRKHCSRIKGGQLATTAAPATVAGLVFSDVVGNDLSVVASGPTAPDASTYADALAVLDRYDVEAPDVRLHLEHGDAGDFPETAAVDDPAFDRVENYVLASGRTAIDAAREVAREADYRPLVLSSTVRGEASDAALTHVAIAEEALSRGDPVEPPAVVLSGGECTVTVEGDGSGGPNQEFALAAALELPAEAVLACVDTDGVDGFSEVAGAIVDASTVDDRAAARGALARNDAGGYLDERDATIRTGPTGTNVNDLRVLVLE